MNAQKLYHKVKNQAGRTMTEIIAVIAVIGVLSLGALYTYNYAMENVRENETLNRASKIIAGARTSYILQNHADATKFYQNGANEGEVRDAYESQPINMNDVISNIGNDFSADGTYILAPLKGPVKNGNEQNVTIAVRVETPSAFTVRFGNLTKQACIKIIRSQNLGYSWAFETEDSTTNWMDSTATNNPATIEALCDRVLYDISGPTATYANPFVKQAFAQGVSQSGTLVLWFGPYGSLSGADRPACSGNGCCCDTDEDGNTSLVGRAGCKMPAGGSCVSCTENDGTGTCVPRAGVTCPNNDVCSVSKCSGYTPITCGKNCCEIDQMCQDGACVSDPSYVDCPSDRNQCGSDCCEQGEICDGNGKCTSDPCPIDLGYRWCIQDAVCCKPGEKCHNGSCVNFCPPRQTACMDECCDTAKNEQCIQDRCVPTNPYCTRKLWQPHYKDMIPITQCSGINGADCCYDGEPCCNGLCCIFGYACNGFACVWNSGGSGDDDCVAECSADGTRGSGVSFINRDGKKECCCKPKELASGIIS